MESLNPHNNNFIFSRKSAIETGKHNSWQLSTITDSITDDDFTCEQVICSSTTDHKITLLLLVH